MKKVRIEIHMSKHETEMLDKIALKTGRSRKNLCEVEIRAFIERWQKEQKTPTKTRSTDSDSNGA